MAEKEAVNQFDDEQIIEIEIERLRSFKNHPFKVEDDKDMHLLKDSIKKYGVLNPLIVRPVPDGVYEIISGHRRKYAAQQLGYRKVPVIIRVMNDEEAIIKMVDSNLQRERISYSEKAFAYKMKNDAMKRTAGRPRSQIDHNLKGKRTVEIIAEETGESPKQVQRIKKLSKDGKLTLEKMQDILSEIKKGEISRVTFTNEQLHRYFPNNYTPEMMKREIVAILKIWMEQYWDK